MRLTLKHQVILAPTVVLLLMGGLLGFLQYNYWDLSLKRQESKNLGTVFISLAEAELTIQRMHSLVMRLRGDHLADTRCLAEMDGLIYRLEGATGRIVELLPLPDRSRALIRQSVSDLDPEYGFDVERINGAIAMLRPELSTLSSIVQAKREKLRNVHRQDIDELVEHTAFVSIVVLGTAIGFGLLLSLSLGRSLLGRIKKLSDSAGRIAGGDLTPPKAPAHVRDELDELALSINSMTDRLIRVVGTEKLLEGAEDERRRIAMDIHDQTLSDLASVLRDVQALKGEESVQPKVHQLEDDLQRAIANLREVMDNLHPQTLDILGLGPALESHLEGHLAKDELPEYHLYISPKIETAGLSKSVQLALYRIAVEAIHNVIRHAKASRYEINLDRREDCLLLSVEDNGTGFDTETVAISGHRGLYNIRERATAIGATVQWGSSRFTTGTRFELILPLPSKETA